MARKKKEDKELQVLKPREIELKSIGEYSKEAFLDYGDYINNHRHMVEVKDGCKISYRRLIYSATQFPKGKLNPTTNLVSNSFQSTFS
jgi:DNA gyrase/topoisomerase IV subunit A